MIAEETKLKGCFVIKPKVFEDKRGYFFECFNQDKFFNAVGENFHFVQDNESKSDYGVLRGLHFQIPPYAQAKLVRVVQGEVLDVAVDLRKNSPTFGQYTSVILNDENKFQLLIPRGFAHGYAVLSKTATFVYKIDNLYSPEHESGIIWNDQSINVDWKLKPADIILSEKDKKQLSFEDFNSPF
jgi:dTDP-4-dehydrorhamnose 3,5-epimerase